MKKTILTVAAITVGALALTFALSVTPTQAEEAVDAGAAGRCSAAASACGAQAKAACTEARAAECPLGKKAANPAACTDDKKADCATSCADEQETACEDAGAAEKAAKPAKAACHG